MEPNYLKPWLSLDTWQKKVLKTKKDICIVSGRQCGKTTIVSILAAQTAANKDDQFILIGSSVIEQAEILFRKIKEYIFSEHEDMIKGRPTLNFMELDNGSKILCVPIGDTGNSMRGYTATMLIIDEAAIVPDKAWNVIEPTISIAKKRKIGRVVLLSTPQGKKGFFYKASENPNYFKKQISARNCPRHSQKFLDQKQAEISPVAFATEYLGEFIDDYNRKFTDEWIDKVCILSRKQVPSYFSSSCFLGVDVGGGVGLGETTFESFSEKNKKVIQVENIYSTTIGGPDIERQIETLKTKFNYGRKSIGYDSQGEGAGSFKYMMENNNLKRCLVDLKNSSRPVEAGIDGKRTKLLKEYMYDVTEEMGWRGELKCFDDGAIKQSFRSIQIEFKKNGDRRYWGTYNHIVEGIVRATWLAKNKSLNIYIY